MNNLINKIKNNKVLSISIIVGVVIVLGLIIFNILYFQKGIGMGVEKKQSQIDKVLLKGDYNKAYKLADVYFENESEENKKAIHKRIEMCEETRTKCVMDAKKIRDRVTVRISAKTYTDKKATIYNINDWINNPEWKCSTLLTNDTAYKGNAKVKFTYLDKDDVVLEQNIEEVEFKGDTKVNVINIPKDKGTISQTSKVKCSIEELHLNKD